MTERHVAAHVYKNMSKDIALMFDKRRTVYAYENYCHHLVLCLYVDAEPPHRSDLVYCVLFR